MNSARQPPSTAAAPFILLTLLAIAGGLWWWTGQGGPPPDPASLSAPERGRLLAAAQGCAACHTLDGINGLGPSWQGLWGKERRFTEGEPVIADEAYLVRAMREPAAEIVTGYQNVMLPVALTDAEIADIIALIRSLGAAQ